MFGTRVILLVAAATVSAGTLAAQTGQTVEPVAFQRVAQIRDARLAETSGVAVSRRHVGILWTHNDSGHEPVLFAIDLSGQTVAAFTVQGATNHDWEDIALGPCPWDPAASCLYIADTGDNAERRSSADIYIVAEPDPTRRTGQTAPSHRLRLTYPTGPHDVEALAVSPDGQISLISKGRSGAVYRFRIPASDARSASVRTSAPERLDIPVTSPASMVTGAAFSPDGRTLVVRTYSELHFFRPDRDGRLERVGLPCYLGLREPQGEAVDFLDANTLILTSEAAFGFPASLARAACPAAGTNAP